jgi:hypothetical protein
MQQSRARHRRSPALIFSFKAIMAAIHEEEFTEPVNAEDWDAYIYDLAFCLERKLGIYAANQTDG